VTGVVRTVRVGIVVDEALGRSALAAVLDADPRITVVHAVDSCARARAVIAPQTVDVLVVDAALPDGNGVALGVVLQRADPRMGVLLLSADDVSDLVLSVRTQVPRPWSHLSRTGGADASALVRAVVATAHGQVVLDGGPGGRGPRRADDPIATLTEARMAVLRLVAQGLSNRSVGRLLGLSPRSVENHLAAVYRALGVTGEDVNPRVAAVLALRERDRVH
jgi:DNA-binding NarL/FixJ family response regulator